MTAFRRIMAGLGDAERHASGEAPEGLVVHVPDSLDVAAIRAKSKLSQPAFARSMGVSLATLRQWEQKRRAPEGSARVLLAMVSRNPRIVLETLGRSIAAPEPKTVARRRTPAGSSSTSA